MTRNEFILKTIISMAGNRAFADSYDRKDSELQTETIINEALILADHVEEYIEDIYFDD